MQKIITNFSFFIIAIISILALSFPEFCYSENNFISKEMALEIAHKKATSLGLNLNGKTVFAETYSYAWNPYIPSKKDVIDLLELGELLPGEIEDLKNLSILLSKLKDKTYWAVIFSPKRIPNKITLDGTNVVFIDAKSGKVLDAF
jgi:hypothetical protein